MTERASDLAAFLKSSWCDAFEAFEGADGALHLSTPFTYDDGDNLPVILERGPDGWVLTDRGNAVARLGYDDEFVLTQSLEETARRIISAGGHRAHGDLE